MSTEENEDKFYKFTNEELFWKMKEAEYLCQSLSQKMKECSKTNSSFSKSACENFEKKLPTCMMSVLSSTLKKCLASVDIQSTSILPSEMRRVEICMHDEKVKSIFEKWSERISSTEMQNPKNFYQHENLTQLDDSYSIEESDTNKKIKERFTRIKKDSLCDLQQRNVKKCWEKMQNDFNETCFKEDSECYNCEVSVLCGKPIRECMEKNKDLGDYAYPVCLDATTLNVQKCVEKFQNFLSNDPQQ
eukprot:gene82-4331_t